MKGNGKALGGVLTPMVKGEKPYDQAAVNEALKALDDTAKKLPTMFPESTKGLKPEERLTALRRRSGKTRRASLPRSRASPRS